MKKVLTEEEKLRKKAADKAYYEKKKEEIKAKRKMKKCAGSLLKLLPCIFWLRFLWSKDCLELFNDSGVSYLVGFSYIYMFCI